MVFEFVFPNAKKENGFAHYVESLASKSGLKLIDQFQSAAVIEGEWEAAMCFLRQCREYVLGDGSSGALTTVHIRD